MKWPKQLGKTAPREPREGGVYRAPEERRRGYVLRVPWTRAGLYDRRKGEESCE
jgi:hypothetical protein